ncbi:MAG: GNAT family N-acetyltransferase [Hyphomicrobiales bacterium]
MSAEYKALFEASCATVFQAPFWLNAFYANLIDPYSLTPIIITIRDGDGLLLFLLPCVRQHSAGLKIVQSADMGVSDYNCIIAREETLAMISEDQELQRCILEALNPFDVFFFRKQRSDKPKIEDILGGATLSKADFHAHEVTLSSSFDSWALDKLTAKFRSSNRRRMKNLIADHGEFQFSIAKDAEQIRAAMEFIRKQRSARYKADILNQPAFYNFYLSLALDHAQDGCVQTSVIHLNGEIIAAFFGLNLDGTHCYILGGFLHEKYSKYSVGILAINATIADRIDHRFKVFDFALGDESYKNDFGTDQINIHNAVYTSTLAGYLVSHTYAHAKPLKNFLKKLNPKLH